MYKLYFDGGKRQDFITYGVVIKNDTDEIVTKFGGKITSSSLTNNAAEYIACMIGLFAARSLGIQQLEVYGDSQLVIYQLNGIYSVKQIILKTLHNIIKDLEEYFEQISFEWVPREKNQQADREGR